MIENKLLTESKEPALGAGGLEFKSPRPDQNISRVALSLSHVLSLKF